MFITSTFSVIRSRSLWSYFRAPAILPYILKTISWINVILGILVLCNTTIDIINKCRSPWPIFHGPVILPHILNVIWCISIIIWDYELVWSNSDLKVNVGHCDLYFIVQWFYVTSWRQFNVLLSYFGIIWPIFHNPVILTYISHYLIPNCHIYI